MKLIPEYSPDAVTLSAVSPSPFRTVTLKYSLFFSSDMYALTWNVTPLTDSMFSMSSGVNDAVNALTEPYFSVGSEPTSEKLPETAFRSPSAPVIYAEPLISPSESRRPDSNSSSRFSIFTSGTAGATEKSNFLSSEAYPGHSI